jgi:hypothetical protein
MSNYEYRLKRLSINVPKKLLIELEKAPLLPGEAGLISNLILLPSDSQLEQDMHVQVKDMKNNKKPFEDFPEDIRIEFEKIRKDLKLKWDKEMKEIASNLKNFESNMDSGFDEIEKNVNLIEQAKRYFSEKAKKDEEKRYLNILRKHHDGLLSCMTIGDVSFLTQDGISIAQNLINLQQLHQTEFQKRLEEKNR